MVSPDPFQESCMDKFKRKKSACFSADNKGTRRSLLKTSAEKQSDFLLPFSSQSAFSEGARGNRSLGHRPASTQRRAAGFGRQFKNCTPSAALKRAALTRAVPPHIIFILALTPPRFRAGAFLRPSRREGGASRRRGSAAAVSAPRADRRWPGPRPGKGRRRFRRLGR